VLTTLNLAQCLQNIRHLRLVVRHVDGFVLILCRAASVRLLRRSELGRETAHRYTLSITPRFLIVDMAAVLFRQILPYNIDYEGCTTESFDDKIP
jgi:hypothetical protein